MTIRTDRGPRACTPCGDGRYVDLNDADPKLPSSLREILGLGADGLEQAKAASNCGECRTDPQYASILPPIPDPQKIICVGLNYRGHAEESGAEVPAEPVLFAKFPSALIGPDDPILIPEQSDQVDYEAELVVVIGKCGRAIPRERAFEHVGGYTIGNDVSARDWQRNKPGRQWTAGKSFDTFAPIGPVIVTPDEVGDPHDLDIRLHLNGRTMQDSSTSEMIFPIDELIAYISSIITLEAGDLIFTGTPPGVGMARKPPVWLKPGDFVEIEVDKIGVLKNLVGSRG